MKIFVYQKKKSKISQIQNTKRTEQHNQRNEHEKDTIDKIFERVHCVWNRRDGNSNAIIQITAGKTKFQR